jgi:HlyD family secretion protein
MGTVSRRTTRLVIPALVIAALIAGGVWGVGRIRAGRSPVGYITRPVAYTDITATVNETGTVNPVDQVQVGSQVSGTIASLGADYNSRVKKGQVLATLDPTTFQAAVEQAAANLAAAQSTALATQSAAAQAQSAVATAAANLQQAQAQIQSARANAAKAAAQLALANKTVERDAMLLKQGFIPQSQMDTDQTAAAGAAQDARAAQDAVQVAQAQALAATSQLASAHDQVTTAQAQAGASAHQVAAAGAQLQQAQYNLSRTVITSPIDGVVMARNVSVGQTVAASLQTPTLFTLATNLTDMQVDTSVDEADVGNVRAGEPAQITVTAFPNVTFSGTVQQVRVNPTVVQNVVTYDAVVAVHDSSGRLKPGMTAQVMIATGTRSHVLAVPTATLLYRPLAARGSSGGGAAGGGFSGSQGSQSGGQPVAGAPGSRVTVWVLRSGRPAPVRIVIGVSDGQNIEVASGGLHEGDQVVIAERHGGARRPGGAPGPGGPGAGGPGFGGAGGGR